MNSLKYLQAQGIDALKGCQLLIKFGLVYIIGDVQINEKAEIDPNEVSSLHIDG
ncbi:hypothetical protein [Kingella kingae]|uniref:hypothetical protein n=1 Tax=Kingella kingae TaxID=504 RepID=UPI00041A45BF|nr:hypothetical protein [Kingella kingae]